MWLIKESRKAIKQLKKCPKNILQEYEVWKKVIELSGPKAIRDITGYKDHSLKGEWSGTRSSYLNKKWRVIYYVHKKEVQVFVMEVNAHDYRKKS
jgi:addiction module RelE/StbE family toxin